MNRHLPPLAVASLFAFLVAGCSSSSTDSAPDGAPTGPAANGPGPSAPTATTTPTSTPPDATDAGPPASTCLPLGGPASAGAVSKVSPGKAYVVPMWASVDSKGRSVVAGYVDNTHVFAARLGPNGTVDASFGAGGMAVVDFGAVRMTASRSFALDAKDRLVFAGQLLGGTDVFVARLTQSGALDTSFAATGVVHHLVDAAEAPTNGLAVATVGTDVFFYASLAKSKQITGAHFDELGTQLPYSITLPGGPSNLSDGLVAAAGGGGFFVGNVNRVYKLTSAGAIDGSYGTSGYVDEPHRMLAPLADGSLALSGGVTITILPPAGTGASTTVPFEDGVAIPIDRIVERCDGTIVVASGDDRTDPRHSVRVVTRDGKPVAGHPTVAFSSPMQTMAAAIDPRTGKVDYFGLVQSPEYALGVVAARP